MGGDGKMRVGDDDGEELGEKGGGEGGVRTLRVMMEM